MREMREKDEREDEGGKGGKRTVGRRKEIPRSTKELRMNVQEKV